MSCGCNKDYKDYKENEDIHGCKRKKSYRHHHKKSKRTKSHHKKSKSKSKRQRH